MTQFKISDYETIKNAMVNRDLKQALYDEGKVIMDGVLLTLHGEEHHKRRKLEHKVFQRDYFKYYEQELFPKTLDETIEPFIKSKKADLIDFGYRITMNLTADFAGIDRTKKTPSETNKLLTLVKKFSEGATLVHSKRDKSIVEKEVLDALDIFETDFLKPSIEKRLKLISAYNNAEIKKDQLPRDVLTVLLMNEDNINLDDDIIKKEIAFYLQAGSHSSANSMKHAFLEISNWIKNRYESYLIRRIEAVSKYVSRNTTLFTDYMKTADEITSELMGAILEDLKPDNNQEVLLHANGFGGTPLMELYLLFNSAKKILDQKNINVTRSLVGNFTTSLDMAGGSLTVTKLDDNIVKHWDSPVHTAALRWKI